MRRLALLVCFLLSAVSLFADDPALVTGRITVFGSKIEVSPPVIETAAGIPVFINTTGKGLGGKLVGELRGPSINGAITFETTPGNPFQLPALTTKGTYFFEDIRLVNSTQVVVNATPDHVEIHVIEILITRISSRPLSLDEIRSLGIVINEADFSAVSFEIGLTFNSRQVQINLPLLLPKRPELSPLIAPTANNVGFASPVGPSFGPGPSALPYITPITFTPDRPEFGLNLPDIPGVLVFPNEIAFLNQFFAVMLMVQNGASNGSSLSADNLTAQIVYDPADLKLRKTNPPVPLGSPVPVRLPGADGIIGTADDLDLIIAQQTGQSEFFVEGLTEGTHIVRMTLHGTLHGLVQGDIAISGTATGAVLVRNPNFAITFSHPSVVRAFEPYDLFVTVTNTSTVDANLVRLSIPTNALVNVTIQGNSYEDFDLISSGESATATFHMLPQITGMVTASVITSSGNVRGQFQFRVGVGEQGIPLSPDTLVLPEYASALGPDFTQKGLNILGLAYSAATAPPGGLPPNIPYVSRGIVFERAVEMAQAGLRFQLGESRVDTLSHLMLDWLGNDVPDNSFDILRKTTNKGQEFLDEVFHQMNVGGSNAITFHRNFADATFYRNRYLSLMLHSSGTAPTVSLADSIGNTNPSNAARLVSEDGDAQWMLLGNFADHASYTYKIIGAGATSNGTLSVIVPLGSSLYRAEFDNLNTSAGKAYTLVVDDNNPSPNNITLLDETGSAIAASLAVVVPQPLQPIAAVQDAKADKTGHVIAVLFNQPVTQITAENFAHYSVVDNRVMDAKLQRGGRIVYLAFSNPISPLIDTDLTIRGMDPPLPGNNQYTIRIQTTATTNAGRVIGRVLGSNGVPIPLAPVTLSEIDDDDILGEATAHITATTTTDANGEFQFDYVRMLSRPFTIEAQDPLSGDVSESSSLITQSNQLLRLDIIMLGRGSVKGKVFRRVSNTIVPMSNMVVSAIPQFEGARSVLTDAAGNYVIDRLAVGTINLSAQNQNLGDPVKYFGATSTAIPAAGAVVTSDIEVTAYQPGRVNGRVLQANGTDPIIHAFVKVSVPIPGTVNFSLATYTDSQGWFYFDQVPAGLVSLTAKDGTTTQDIGAASVNLSAGGNVTVNIIAKGNGNVGVFVTPATGMNLSDIAVYIEGTSFIKDPLTGTSTFFQGVPVGTWIVTAVHKLTGDKATALATVLYASSTTTVSLRFAEKGTVSGNIKTVDGAQAPRATALLFNANHNLIDVTTADNAGHYLFRDVVFNSTSVYDGYEVHAISENQNDGGKSNGFKVTNTSRNVTTDVRFLGKGSITVHVETSAGPVMTPVTLSTVTFDVDGRITRGIHVTKTSNALTGNVIFDDIFRTSFSVEASTPLTLPARVSGTLNAPTTTVNILLTPNPNISGVVHDADGNPILSIVTYTGDSGTQIVTTAPDGTFAFSRLAPGHALFVASANGTKGQLAINIGDINDPIDIHLLGSGDLHGMVKDAAGNPIAGASLKLSVHGLLARTLNSSSRSDGTYSFTGVPEGPINLEASNSVVGGRAVGTIIHRADIPLDVVLDATGTVQGTVFQPDGVTRVPNVEVTLVLATQQAGITTSDGNGNFLFRYVGLNRYSDVPYLVAALDKNTGRRAQSSAFLITANGQVITKNLKLEGKGTVSGFVFDSTGLNAISGAHLTLVSSGIMTQTLTATSGANGDFVFSSVPQGPYILTASKDLLAGQVTGRIDSEGQQVQHTIQLQPSAEINGTIAFFDGTALPAGVNPVVHVTGVGVNLLIDAPDGRFRVEGLPLSAYTLTTNFSHNGTPYRGRVAVNLTQPGETDVTLQLKGLNTINITVNGAVDATTTITLVYRNDMESRTETRAAPAGTTTFEFIPESTYTLSARTGSLLKGSVSGTLTGDGQTANVTINLTRSGSVAGTVLKPDLQAASGVTVALTGVNFTLYDFTDASGQFRIDGVLLGNYTLQADDLTNGGKARAYASIDAESETDNFTLTLDATPPQVLSSNPSNAQTAVSNDSTIHVVFSEPMDAPSIQAAFALTSSSGTVNGSLQITGTELIFTPAVALAAQRTYTLVVSAAAEDVAGNRLASDYTASFTTIDTVTPTISTTVPLHLAYNVPVNTKLQVFFSETIADRGTYTVTRSSGLNATVSNETWNAAHTVLTLQFASAFQENERITFSISGYSDTAGNVQTIGTQIFFDTIDTTPPAPPILTSNDADNQIREGSSITITAIPSESLVNVDFYINSTFKLHDTVSPYQYVIPSSLTMIAANGSDQLVVEASATDRSGNVSAKSPLTIHLIPDTAPQISITTSPVPGPVLIGSMIHVDYNASDDGAITKVQIIVTGAMNQTIDAGSATSGSRDITVPTTVPESASIFIEGRATDDSGKSTSTAKLTFTTQKDTEAPSVTITEPPGGHIEITEGETFTVAATVTDNLRVDKVQFEFNSNTIVDTTVPYQVQFAAPSVSQDTTFTGVVTGFDQAGNTTAVSFTVLVKRAFDPGRPTVQFLCPTEGGLFSPNYNLNISVRVTDDQNVDRVEFYRGADTTPFSQLTSIASANTTVSTTNLLSGFTAGQSVSFRAVVFDYAGNSEQAIVNIAIVDGTHITTGISIPNNPSNPYENKTLIVENGGIVTIDGNHTFQDFVVLNGGIVQHSDTTTTAEFKLKITASRVSLACGGKIDVTGRGYDAERTYPNSGIGATVSDNNAGSYGGLGGATGTSFSATTYGSFVNPNESGGGAGLGTASGGASGGGVIWIETGSLVLDGNIFANGAANMSGISFGAGGAGGAIQIHMGSISGSGQITANGGAGTSSRSGGGGRVSISYTQDQMASGLLSHVQARGATGSLDASGATGGAGTIYVLDSTQGVYGDLIVNNSGASFPAQSRETLLPAIGTGTISVVSGNVITGPSAFAWSVIGLYLRVLNADGSTQGDYRIIAQSGSTLTLEGLTVNVTGKSYRGVVKLDHLNSRGGAILKTSDLIELSEGIAVDGATTGGVEAEVHALGDSTLTNGAVLALTAPLRANGNLTLQNGAMLTHKDTTTSQEYKLEVHVVGQLSIDATSKIDVTGRGYDAERTYPNSTVGATVSDNNAGSYGGLGGASGTSFTATTYGSFVNPNESGGGAGLGTASGGASGGGVIWIETGSVVLDGNIFANGAANMSGISFGAGGAGGAIQIHTGSISGSGQITANGGAGTSSRSGGGGRVSISYTQDQMLSGLLSHVQAHGGTGSRDVFPETGGAGTIYLFSNSPSGGSVYGNLIANNTGASFPLRSQSTTVPAIGSGSISQLTQDSQDLTKWSIRTSVTVGFPFNLEGGYIIFHGPYGDSPRYYIIGRSATDARVLFFRIDSVQPTPIAVGVINGDTYSGAYQLDSIKIQGGAVLVFADPVYSPSIVASGSGSKIQAPNLP